LFLLKVETEPARSSVDLPSGGPTASFHSGCLTSDPYDNDNIDGSVAEAKTTISHYGDVTPNGT
jgi:hypothetical protein